MSPKKITDTDKLELVQLYRQAGETTASLANRYGVSNSTISRILKTTIPEPEYEELIQQKRGAKNGSDEELSAKVDRQVSADAAIFAVNTAPDEPMFDKLAPAQSAAKPALESILDGSDSANESNLDRVAVPLVPTLAAEHRLPIDEDLGQNNRRVRRRSSAPEGDLPQPTTVIDAIPTAVNDFDRSTQTLVVSSFTSSIAEPPLDLTSPVAESIDPSVATQTPVPSTIQRTPILRNARPKPDEYLTDSGDADPTYSIETGDSEEDEDEEDNPEDVNILAAMFGEEIADADDDDFEDDEDEDDEFSSTDRQSDRELLPIDRLHLQIIPLSQATLPRTCYIVIDKFAELIVRPLKDFAELGQIPGEEMQQRTLPIFDNHRVAKRFSNQRTQRVIKVPDSKVFHKTSQHLQSKGIARLLVDGNIYSLN
jgi:hypothetical protein